jgi:hypothetical protein
MGTREFSSSNTHGIWKNRKRFDVANGDGMQKILRPLNTAGFETGLF